MFSLSKGFFHSDCRGHREWNGKRFLRALNIFKKTTGEKLVFFSAFGKGSSGAEREKKKGVVFACRPGLTKMGRQKEVSTAKGKSLEPATLTRKNTVIKEGSDPRPNPISTSQQPISTNEEKTNDCQGGGNRKP